MLKNLMQIALIGTTLGTLGGCANTTQEQNATACANAGATVRTVTDVSGTVIFDQKLQQYKIMAPEAGTVDVVDIGVVCGTLPEALRKEGAQVVFSGTYKAYPSPPAAPAGYTTYYLEVSGIKAQ